MANWPSPAIVHRRRGSATVRGSADKMILCRRVVWERLAVFLFLALVESASAQEVRRIEVAPQQEDRRMSWINSYTYAICGSDKQPNAPRVIRVSVESVHPAEVPKSEPVEVVLKIENSGSLPVVLPVSQHVLTVEKEDKSIHYRAQYQVLGAVPSRAALLGWLELYGSSSTPDSLLI
jgi:hypothetical protein